jgi:hypothetical protein
LPNHLFVAAAVLSGSLLAELSAQVLHIGGSSPDYLDLPAAVAAAAPGSILVVHPGKYTGFTTGKPLRIHLDFPALGGWIAPATGSAYAVTLSGLPVGGEFVLTGDGASIRSGALGAIRVQNTAGRVVLEGLTVAAGTGAAIDVQNAGPVLLHDCDLSGTPGLQVHTATVVANDLRVASPAGHALAASDSLLDLAGGSYAGRDLPALHLVDCDIRLAGQGATPIKVGGTSPLPVPAFVAINCHVQWDPSRFFLLPANGAVAFSVGGNTTVLTEDAPIVTARGGPPGGNGWMRLTSNTPLPGMVVLAPFAPPVFLGIAGLYIDLGQPYGVPLIGVADPAGLSLAFAIPTTASLLGDVSCLQGAVFGPLGFPTLSGPVPLVTL